MQFYVPSPDSYYGRSPSPDSLRRILVGSVQGARGTHSPRFADRYGHCFAHAQRYSDRNAHRDRHRYPHTCDQAWQHLDAVTG